MLKAFADGSLFGASYGPGEPWVLALHGWQRSHSDFDGLFSSIPALAGIAVDLPGFGATPEPDRVWGAADYASALVPMLDEFKHPPVVVGHSFGGRVALSLAVSHPDRIRALVLTGVPLLRPADEGPRPGVPVKFRLARALRSRGLLSAERMEAYAQRFGSTDYRRAQGVMRPILVRSVNETYEDQLRALRVPLELVWGEDDADVPLVVARAAAALVESEGAGVVAITVCPGAGHLTPLTATDALAQALLVHRVDGATGAPR
ncbi:MAG: alpha/beta fold hydrolase [Acidimicrobiales bacterium]